MSEYRQVTPFTTKGTYLRKRIAKTRIRAKCIGYVYLLAIFLIAAAACFPLLSHEYAPIGVLQFWKQLKPNELKAFDYRQPSALIPLAVCALYALMLLGVAVNVLRSLRKLRWLHKKKPSKQYGFNRNVYAMEDLGRIFSGSFSVVVATYFLIAILCGITKISGLLLLFVGCGVFLHLLLGLWGSAIAYFDIHQEKIVEQRRQVGYFSPLLRNALQLIGVFGLFYCFLQYSTLQAFIPRLTQAGGFKTLLENRADLLSFSMQLVIVLCTLVLLKHAAAITEFNMDGADGTGMKNFRVFAFFVFLASMAVISYKYVFIEGKMLDKQMAEIAAIAFALFLIELIMHAMPAPLRRLQTKTDDNENEFTLEKLLHSKNGKNTM